MRNLKINKNNKFFFFFLGPHLGHMNVFRLGVELELQLPAYTIASAMIVQAVPATYTTAHGITGSLTHWVRPGIEPTTSRFLVGFISTVPWQELPLWFFFEKHLHIYIETETVGSSVGMCKEKRSRSWYSVWFSFHKHTLIL